MWLELNQGIRLLSFIEIYNYTLQIVLINLR